MSMESESVSLVNAIVSTTMWAMIWLAINSIVGTGLGWLLGQTERLASISQRILQFLTYWAVISASKIFCLLLVIALLTTKGVQKAKQAGNQWQLMITHTFLGMRLSLILFWVLTQSKPEQHSPGLGNYIFDAYNNGDTASLLQALVMILILAILFDQGLNFLEKLLLNRVAKLPRGTN